jgi:hypothetical protein
MVPAISLANVDFATSFQPEMGGNVTIDGSGAWGRAVMDMAMKHGLLYELDLGTAYLTLQNLVLANL